MLSLFTVISYPISDGKDFNMVLSHFHDPPVDPVHGVCIVEKIPPGVSRWPLLVTGPLSSWSSREKNIVLIGDAAHSMTNHMAQGAATSMEDGAFLARCLNLVIQGKATVGDAVGLYEKGRMPKATYKQQLSFSNGWIWHLPDGPAQQARDKAMECELRGEVPMRSPNLYGGPRCIQESYGYDAEQHAEDEIATWLNNGQLVRDARSTVQPDRADQLANWFLPIGHQFQILPRL